MKSFVLYPADGTTKVFNIPFGFISNTHLVVKVNGILQYRPGDYKFQAPNQIVFSREPGAGDKVEIRRVTPSDDLIVRFQNGAVLTEAELNTALEQLLYITQEANEYANALLQSGLVRLNDGTAVGPDEIIDAVVQDVLNSTLLDELQQRITDIDLNAETINAQRMRLDTIEDIIDALSGDGSSLTALILDEQNARIAGDTALIDTIALLGARSGDGLAFIADLNTLKVSPTESFAQRFTAISAATGANSAAITNEITARTNADSALTNALNLLTARTATAEANILTEQTARATADSALASSITTLSATVGSNTAAISTQASVIDGIRAQYGVRLDVNGYVAGFGLLNGGPGSSEFIILADKFALVTPGEAPVVPFAADASGVYIENAYIRNLQVDKITGGNIGSQWNIVDANGKIVLDTGTHQKVIGVGFGANGDLVEWFGPKIPINTCTRANGTTWVATDGDAYFGGSLSAGVLFNARQSTDLSVPAEVILGPYGTNGNPKTIVYTYTYQAGGSSATPISTTPGTATGRLYRKLGTGAEVEVDSFTVNSVRSAGEFDSETGRYIGVSEGYSFSRTLTDAISGTDDRTYRLVLETRGTATFTFTGRTQRLGITSTEN